MRFVGAKKHPSMEAIEPEMSKSNYYLGNHSRQWRAGISRYARLVYHNLYPGIDAVYYGSESRIEYDLVVQPGADPNLIELQFAGTTKVRIDETGDLILGAGSGELRQRKPVFYQDIGSKRSAVTGQYRLDPANKHVRFEVSGYDRSKPLIIDPILYSSYFGGNGADYALGFARDTSGNLYMTGSTTSTNLPVTNGTTRQGTQDAYVVKFNASGGLVWCTYLGGSASDTPLGIAVDPAGNVYVEGRTVSTDFPLASAFQSVRNGASDAFVTKLDSNGALVYSTYLGGSADEYGLTIGVDASGSAVVAGATSSSNFPTVNAFQSTWRGANDGFVAKLNVSGNGLIYSSYMGGSGQDYVNKVTVLADGETFTAGDTSSTNLPVYQALQPQNAGAVDGFVARISPTGSLRYWTYLGGSASDATRDIKLTASGEAWVVSGTSSTNAPLINPYWPLNSGGDDFLLQRINATGTALTYSSYFGGSGDEHPIGLILDATENVYVVGTTTSTNLPKAGSLQPSLSGAQDGVILKLDPTGTNLLFSSYFGGSNVDTILDAQLEAEGKIWVAGDTLSTNFPTVLPSQPASGGLRDAFLARIDTCSYEVSSANQIFQSTGGNGTVHIITTPECSWTAATNAPWISFTSPSFGTGNGSVDFSVAPNTALAATSGSITVGGQTITIDEAGTAASLTAISPASGGAGTAVAVALTGSNFAAGMTVTSTNPGITITNLNVLSSTQLTATLNIAANAALGSAAITVTVAGGSSNPIPFTVSPLPPTLASVTPASSQNGANVAVTLTGTQFVAPADVASNNANILTSSAVVVSSTQMNVTLAVAPSVTPGSYELRVTTPGGTSNPVTFTVNPPPVSSLTISSASILGGNTVNATVTLTAPAPAGGVAVTMISSDPAATVPATANVAAGVTTVVVPMTTSHVAVSTAVTISASLGGVTKTANLTVNPLAVSGIVLGSFQVAGGANIGNNMVVLNGPAGPGDAIVALSSSNPTVAPVPATITVPAGATQSLAFSIPTATVAGITQVNITATLNGSPNTVVLTVNPVILGQTIWNSYDVITRSGTPQATVADTSWQRTATVELYESTNNGGVNKGSLFAAFTAGAHSATFNHAQNYWSPASATPYPYGGKSTVERGLDSNETNAPAPSGVYDLQVHTPNNDHLVVTAFQVPENGNYEVSNLAVRRVDGNPNQTVRYRVFNPQQVQITNLLATSNQAWVTDPNTYPLGQLTAGQYIYFGVARDGAYSYDATEISWTVREITPLPDFTLNATPASQTVAQGANTSFAATATAQNGFTGSIGFTVNGLPAGATGDFAPATVANSGTATLTIATNGAAAGSYPLTITASGNSITKTANVTLVISGPPDFTVNATPASRSVTAGAVTTYTVTTTAQNGFAGIIGFSVTGLPVGAGEGFSPSTVTGSGGSTLTITTGGGTVPGTYPLTITATSGALTHTAAVSLTITIGGQSKTWNSYDVVTQAGTPQATVMDTSGLQSATVEIFESTNNGGVNKGSLLAAFTAGAHSVAFNRAQNYWSPAAGTLYPYGGKSMVGRGSDTGETNAAAPASVFDLQLHPPNNDHLVVAAFMVPADGNYQVNNLAVRRVDGNPNQTVRYRVFNPQKVQIANLQATSNQAWVTDPNTYTLGQLTSGQYIYFGVARDGTYSWDATEISWTVQEIAPVPDFTLNAAPPTNSVMAGEIATYTVSATAQNGFAGGIGFSVTGLPAGVTGGFSPSTVTGSGTSTLTIPTGIGTAPGTYPLTITATSGGLTHTAAVSLTVAVPGQSTVWNSYNVVTQTGTPQAIVTDTSGLKTATVELYESTNNGGVNKGSLFATFTSGLHPAVFNRAQAYWSAAGGQTYPYGGKSTVGRGLDTGETNAAAPAGVFDLQLHPPNNDHLVVAAYLVPENGTYEVSNLAVRRVDGNPNQTVRYRVFNPQKVQIANLQATSNQAWVSDPSTYSLGQLTAGQYIYFGVARDGGYSWDASEINWAVTKTGP